MLKAQGQSFHFCIIILRFLAAFAIAKITFVGRHRIHITNGHCTTYAWIFCIWMVRQWQTEHLLSIAAEDCCTQNIVLNYIWSSSHTGSSIWCRTIGDTRLRSLRCEIYTYNTSSMQNRKKLDFWKNSEENKTNLLVMDYRQATIFTGQTG